MNRRIVAACTRLAAGQDGVHAGQVEAGHVFVRGAPRGQFESEVRYRGEDAGIAGHLLDPPGGPLQKRHRAHQHRVQPHRQRAGDPEQQTHVVVDRQPGDQRGVQRRDCSLGLEVVFPDLPGVGQDVLMGDYDRRRRTRRARGVLQQRVLGRRRSRSLQVRRRIQVEAVDLDKRGRRAGD